jgi:uncharacterized membrane protein YfcA
VTTELTILRSSWWKLWPVFLAVICGQMLGILLARWLSFHFAMGLAWFVALFFAALMLARRFYSEMGNTRVARLSIDRRRCRPFRHSVIVFPSLEIDRVNRFLS